MGDDRYCHLHFSDRIALDCLDSDQPDFDLPDDDIKVPLHLLPSYQDEDDETVLPSSSHPSYPYGNPYTPRPFSSSSSLSTSLLSHTSSLSSSLSSLSRQTLPNNTPWQDLALGTLLEESERTNEGMMDAVTAGDAQQPTGQNAGDHPEDEAVEEGQGEGEMET